MRLEETLKSIKKFSRELVMASDQMIVDALLSLAGSLEENTDLILAENAKDLEKISSDDPTRDRVMLNEDRIKELANGVRTIAGYNSPVDVTLEERTLENGLQLKKISTPLGVVGVVFEARPNIVVDIFALCLKSKNTCVLKGGSKSEYSNAILVKIIKEAVGSLADAVVLLPNDREILAEFFKADKYVDVLIPRGGNELINFVRENSLIPVIETGAGVVHTFVDESADLQKAREIIFNAKTSRPSVCNTLDTLIIHRERLEDLPQICLKLAEKEVEIHADSEALRALEAEYPEKLLMKAEEENFGMEYLSLKMAVKTVGSLDEAIEHINNYGSGHSEAIITGNKENAKKFLHAIDAAAVYVNASTRFTDGGVFGLGAEVGISTQKLHARGPMGIKELTSYKWEIIGDGQTR